MLSASARETDDECHISSLVLHCRPEAMDDAIAKIEAMDGVEVPQRDPSGKSVILIESASQGAILERITEIESLPGVINATLVYHQIDN